MRFYTQKKHIIDFLFPLALFFVFTVSAITVILLSTNIYRSTTEHSALNYTAATSLSYVTEKIHQNDHGGIVVGSFDSHDALVLEASYQGSDYQTIIYEHDGQLRELFIKKGVLARAEDGRSILPVRSFSISQPNPQSFLLSCVDDKGQEISCIVSIRSDKRSLS